MRAGSKASNAALNGHISVKGPGQTKISVRPAISSNWTKVDSSLLLLAVSSTLGSHSGPSSWSWRRSVASRKSRLEQISGRSGSMLKPAGREISKNARIREFHVLSRGARRAKVVFYVPGGRRTSSIAFITPLHARRSPSATPAPLKVRGASSTVIDSPRRVSLIPNSKSSVRYNPGRMW